MATTFQIILVTPAQQLLDEQVTYASVPAWDGLFGVMPQRAPLLAKLGSGHLRVDLPSGTSKQFSISGGFAQMTDNKLTILTDKVLDNE